MAKTLSEMDQKEVADLINRLVDLFACEVPKGAYYALFLFDQDSTKWQATTNCDSPAPWAFKQFVTNAQRPMIAEEDSK